MKKLTLVLFFISLSALSYSQSSTEIYLFNLNKTDSTFKLSNPINISDNIGYDNQPSFTGDGNAVLFASTRNDQTDILWYDIGSGSKTWISDTPGGEYSPTLMPGGKHISAVRLDPDGLQLLYKYSIKTGESEVLVPDLKIGYYTWFLTSKLIAFVLGEPATIQEIDMVHNETKSMYSNPGRSIHYIPNTKDYSFIDKSDSNDWKIKRAVPGNKEWTKEITSTLPGVEDMVWLDSSTIVMGKESKLFYFDTHNPSGGWNMLADLSEYKLEGITRLAYHFNKLAVVIAGK